MPANDEFPRGWSFTTGHLGPGSTIQIVVPGVAGMAHVLTDLKSILRQDTGVAVAEGVLINGVFWALNVVTGAQSDVSEATFSGKMAIPIGQSLTIAWNGVTVPAGCTGIITASGYEI